MGQVKEIGGVQKKLLKSLIVKAVKARAVLYACIALVAVFLVFNHAKSDISGYFSEPSEVKSMEEIKKRFKDGKPFVRLKKDEVLNTDYIITETRTKNGVKVSERDISFYAAAFYEGGILLVNLPYDKYYNEENPEIKNLDVTGKLRISSEGTEAKGEIVKHVAKGKEPGAEKILSASIPEFYLDVYGNDREKGRMWLAVSFLVLAVTGILFARLKKVFQDYRNHPSYKALGAYGNPAEVERKIESDNLNKQKELIAESGDFHMFNTYTVYPEGYKVNVKPTKEIGWIYKKTVTNKTYFITTSKDHMAVIRFLDGKTAEAKLRTERDVEEFLERISGKLPGVIVGFTKEAEKIFNEKAAAYKKSQANKVTVRKK